MTLKTLPFLFGLFSLFSTLAQTAPAESKFVVPTTPPSATITSVSPQKTLQTLPVSLSESTFLPQNQTTLDWREEAQMRIDKYRKGAFKIRVIDENGAPVTDLEVTAKMMSHQFGFGSTVDSRLYLENLNYRNVVTTLFNEVNIANDLNWNVWYNPSNQEYPKQVVNKLNENNIAVRGNALVWPSYKYNPAFLKQEQLDANGLRRAINSFIKDITGAFDGQLIDWDVLNAPFENHDFMDELGFQEMAEWFTLAKKQDSRAKLFISDQSILSNSMDSVHQDDFYDKIQYILDLGGHIDGIALQENFTKELTTPERLYTILDRFSSFKKDIKITSFDVSMGSEFVQAQYAKDFMTLIFSHPSVTSFITAGFWEGRTDHPNAAMFSEDWTPKKNFDVFRDLVYKEWWTAPTTFVSDRVSTKIEGFLGTYELSTLYNGQIYRQTVTMNMPHSERPILFKLTNETEIKNAVVVYPNMSDDVILISGLGNSLKRSLKKITLTDMSGKVLYSQNIDSQQRNSIVVNFKGANALYVLRMFDEDGTLLYQTKVYKDYKG